jgi:hypothetical protein
VPKKKTKKQNKQVLRLVRLLEIILVSVSFAWVFFFFVLSISGGWDDIHLRYVMVAPFLAALGLGVASYRIYYQKTSSNVAIPPLAALGVSSLFMCIVAVVEAIAYTATL